MKFPVGAKLKLKYMIYLANSLSASPEFVNLPCEGFLLLSDSIAKYGPSPVYNAMVAAGLGWPVKDDLKYVKEDIPRLLIAAMKDNVSPIFKVEVHPNDQNSSYYMLLVRMLTCC